MEAIKEKLHSSAEDAHLSAAPSHLQAQQQQTLFCKREARAAASERLHVDFRSHD
jgi:hypothetical protein